MEYLKQLEPDEFEYYQKEIVKINQKIVEVETNRKRVLIIFFIGLIIYYIFFDKNIYFFSLIMFFNFGYMIINLENESNLKLDKQSKLNELLIKSIDELAKDKILKEKYSK